MSGWVLASPVIGTTSNGTTYVLLVSDSGAVSALRAVDGSSAWLTPPSLGSAIRSTPCSDGVHWFVFTVDGSMSAINADDGSQVVFKFSLLSLTCWFLCADGSMGSCVLVSP